MYGPEKDAQREFLTWVYRLYKGWRRLVRRELGTMDESTFEVIDGVVHQEVADGLDGGRVIMRVRARRGKMCLQKGNGDTYGAGVRRTSDAGTRP